MRLGGWLRLWLVLSLGWGIVIATFGYTDRPKVDAVITAWAYEGTDVIGEQISEREGRIVDGSEIRSYLQEAHPTNAQLVTWFESVERNPKASQLVYLDALKAVNAKFRARMADIPAQQRRHAFNAFLVWIIPLLGIIALGYATRWIWRGFRPRTAT